MIDFQYKGKTITGNYVFDVTDDSSSNSCGEETQKVVQICLVFVFTGQCYVEMQKIPDLDLGFELLEYPRPPYSPNLASCVNILSTRR